jgi:DNA-3-methyladenine glycosylase
MKKSFRPLKKDFYHQPTLVIAQRLLGKILVRREEGSDLAGKIVETEAYIGEDDPACHASVGKTPRNAVMYGAAGHAYVYFIYGMYYCLNVVTETEGFPAAVLIRAIEPLSGVKKMQELRKTDKVEQLTNGPGKICQAFKIDRLLNGLDLSGDLLFIVNGNKIETSEISNSNRVGIKAGLNHKWRFYIKNNSFVSQK